MENLVGSHLGESLQGKHNSCVLGTWDNNLNEIALSGRWVCAHSAWRCWRQRLSPLAHPSLSPPRQTHPLSNSQINMVGSIRKISLPVELSVDFFRFSLDFSQTFSFCYQVGIWDESSLNAPMSDFRFSPIKFNCFSSHVSILSGSLYYWPVHSGVHDLTSLSGIHPF